MTKSKGAAAAAAPVDAKPSRAKADPDRCARSRDGIHHWTDQVEGRERIRTTVQVCGACGRRLELSREVV